MNKKQKLVRKKHRKTRDRLKGLKIISLTKVKKKPKVLTTPEVIKPNAQETTSQITPPEKEAVLKKAPEKEASTKKTPAKKTAAKKAPAKKAPVKKAPVKKAPVKKAN